jgi:tetratricopeptide (TPR) repeat protein
MVATRIESAENQIYVAGYAEQIGFPRQAAEIYARLLDQGGDNYGAKDALSRPRRLACYTGLLRTRAGAMTLEELRARVGAFAAEFPEIDEVQNDNAYLQLLSGGDIDKAERTAERLLKKTPQLLAYRTTAALSALRRQKTKVAAALYEGWDIDWSTAQDQYKAVYVAVMRAAGRTAEADKVVETINSGALRPEERLLAGLP